eukprot:PLAT3064.1.p1 GENE.PLAT3064.1~~PLAT3064.1.p1  ORF type:complete len:535 (-),score=158.16 PLAT3064.1:88-1647(-)
MADESAVLSRDAPRLLAGAVREHTWVITVCSMLLPTVPDLLGIQRPVDYGSVYVKLYAKSSKRRTCERGSDGASLVSWMTPFNFSLKAFGAETELRIALKRRARFSARVVGQVRITLARLASLAAARGGDGSVALPLWGTSKRKRIRRGTLRVQVELLSPGQQWTMPKADAATRPPPFLTALWDVPLHKLSRLPLDHTDPKFFPLRSISKRGYRGMIKFYDGRAWQLALVDRHHKATQFRVDIFDGAAKAVRGAAYIDAAQLPHLLKPEDSSAPSPERIDDGSEKRREEAAGGACDGGDARALLTFALSASSEGSLPARRDERSARRPSAGETGQRLFSLAMSGDGKRESPPELSAIASPIAPMPRDFSDDDDSVDDAAASDEEERRREEDPAVPALHALASARSPKEAKSALTALRSVASYKSARARHGSLTRSTVIAAARAVRDREPELWNRDLAMRYRELLTELSLRDDDGDLRMARRSRSSLTAHDRAVMTGADDLLPSGRPRAFSEITLERDRA